MEKDDIKVDNIKLVRSASEDLSSEDGHADNQFEATKVHYMNVY